MNSRDVIVTKSLARIDNSFQSDILYPKIQDVHFQFFGSNIGLIREIFGKNCYQFDTSRTYGTVVDLGANVGVFSILASKFSEQVVSVEMNRTDTAELFNRLIDINNVQNISRIYATVGQKKSGNLCLEDLLAEYDSIDFMKIDIEGSEQELFDDEAWLDKVQTLSLEVHPCFGVDVERILAILEKKFNCTLFNLNMQKVPAIKGMGYIFAEKRLPKLLYVNTHSPNDRKFGGVVKISSLIANELATKFNLTYISSYSSPNDKYQRHGYRSVFCRTRALKRHGVSMSMFGALYQQIKQNELIYINGIYTFPVTIALLLTSVMKKKTIVCVRGGLEAWRIQQKSSLIKKIYLKIMSRMNHISLFHATSENEAKDLAELFDAKVQIVENFVLTPSLPERRTFSDRRRLLFVSRFSQEKGLDLLSKAIRLLPQSYIDNFVLQLVGPHGDEFLTKNKLTFDCEYAVLGAKYGDELDDIYQSADGFILPSYSENFGNVVAEALSRGLYTITTTGTPWKKYKGQFSGAICECNEIDLSKAIKDWMDLPDTALASAHNINRTFVNDNFNREKIVQKLTSAINKI
jgi:glycosyltransferase involved in cell wall biosynthesis